MWENFCYPISLAKSQNFCYLMCMGTLKQLSWRRVSALIDMFGGEDGFRQMVLARVGDGQTLDEIAGGFGCTRSVMWSYIKATPGMLEAYQESQEAAAEGMVGEVVGIADGSEDAKLRIDTRLRLAKSWSPDRYGEKAGAVSGGGFGGITIVIGEVKPAGVEQIVGGVVDGESKVVEDELVI